MKKKTDRFAAIDIGSNSTLLLVVEQRNGQVTHVLVDTKETTRLSAGMGKDKTITATAISRQFAVLERFESVLENHHVENVAVCATQVFRIARNGKKLAEEIFRRYGWVVEIISGRREAKLSFRAAATGLKGFDRERIVLDVGGGSTEIVHGDSGRLAFMRSFAVGAVNLAERCALTSVVDNQALEEARRSIKGVIVPKVVSSIPKNLPTLVVGGSASTLAAFHRKLRIFSPESIHGVELTRNWLRETIDGLSMLTTEERQRTLEFDPDRAETIVAGALIIEHLLDTLDVKHFIVSNRGLRWGLLFEKFPSSAQGSIKQDHEA